MQKRTVIILGAGASNPYGFPLGNELLRFAQQGYRNEDALANFIPWADRGAIPAFREALDYTLDQSIDAMLENLPEPVVKAGKGFMAKRLIGAEYVYRRERSRNDRQWYHLLWNAFNLESIEAFGRTELTLVTYNYDRSLEYDLFHALRTKFPTASNEACKQAMLRFGPIHLHGSLGVLPELANPGAEALTVPFGSQEHGPTNEDCRAAAESIMIVHQPDPQSAEFIQAREAISKAARIVFLGFGYSLKNLQRLELQSCIDPYAEVCLCRTGFSDAQYQSTIRPFFANWLRDYASVGSEREDIVGYFRRYPTLLI